MAANPQLTIDILLNDKQALGKLQRSLGSIERTSQTSANKISTAWLDVAGKVFLAQQAFRTMNSTISAAIGPAIRFESAFAGVRKTVDATEAEFAELSKGIINISRQIPVAADQLARIQELAGQLGVKGVKDLEKFTETIAKVAVTTNLTEEAAATAFARIANVMQEPLDNIDRMGAVVVALGNNFATTESEITTFANRIAATGSQAGLTTDEILAIGAAMSSVGIQAEAGGTAVQKVLQSLIKDGKNGSEAFVEFVSKLQGSGQKAIKTLEDLGFKEARVQRAFLSLAGSGGILEDALSKANTAWDENNALQEEAAKRFATTESKIQLLNNEFTALSIEMGTNLLPTTNAVLEKFQGIVNAISTLETATNAISGLSLGGLFGFGAELGDEAGASILGAIDPNLIEEQLTTVSDLITDFQRGIGEDESLLGQLAGNEDDVSKLKENIEEFQGAFKSGFGAIEKDQKKLFLNFAKDVGTATKQATKMFSSTITSIIVGEKKAGEAFKELGNQILKIFLDLAIQFAIQQAIALASSKTIAAVMSASLAVIGAAAAGPAALVSLATAGGNAPPAIAGMASAGAAATALQAIGSIGGLAEGGTVLSPGDFIVGERGPERLRLPTGSEVSPLDSGGGGTVINIELNNVSLNSEDDIRELAQQVSEFIAVENSRL